MRLELSVTSMSWIPSDSAPGLFKAGFAVGASHCDDPPLDVIDDLAERKQITPRPPRGAPGTVMPAGGDGHPLTGLRTVPDMLQVIAADQMVAVESAASLASALLVIRDHWVGPYAG
jgi:hypothetical protein